MPLSDLWDVLSPNRTKRTQSASRRVRLEALEERLAPATLLVDASGTHKPGAFTTIQAAIDAAGANDTVKVFQGTYAEALTINKTGLSLVAAGPGVTIQSPASVKPFSAALGAAVIDVYAKNVTVAGFTVDGSTNTDGNLDAGIRVIQGGSATIEDNTITGLTTAANVQFGIGVQIGTSRDGVAGAGTATVVDNVITTYLSAGVLVDGSSASAGVKDNTITGRGLGNNGLNQYGVQVSRGASASVEGNVISGNDVDGAVPGGSDPSPTSAGIFFFQVSRAAASSNDVSGNDDGILVQQSTGANHEAIEVEGNRVSNNNGFAGIQVRDSRALEVEGNTVANNGTFNGIALSGSSDVEVSGNRVFGNAGDGIYVFQSSGNEIDGNRSYRNGGSGIFLEQSSTNDVENNRSWANQQDGIRLLGGAGNAVTGNRLRRNAQDGISLESSDHNVLKSNEIWFSGANGVHLLGASSNVISNADVRFSGANGVLIEGGQGNSLEVESVGNRGDGIQLKNTQGTSISDSDSRCNGGAALTQIAAQGTTVTHSRLINGSCFICCPCFGDRDFAWSGFDSD
jgi:parallel beta-helix repeat protein